MSFDGLRASCPNCGDIEIPCREVTISVRFSAMQYAYSFKCPQCSFWTARQADPSVVATLVRAGAHVQRTCHPSQSESADGPLTDARLTEWLRALERWPTTTE